MPRFDSLFPVAVRITKRVERPRVIDPERARIANREYTRKRISRSYQNLKRQQDADEVLKMGLDEVSYRLVS